MTFLDRGQPRRIGPAPAVPARRGRHRRQGAPRPRRRPPTGRRSWRSAAALAAIVIAVAATLVGRAACSASVSSAFSAPFATNSPWRQTIPPNPVIDPNSTAMTAFAQSTRALYANLVEFGIPVYKVTPDMPAHAVTCTEDGWGVCPFAGWPVLIPPDAAPHSGSDGAMITVDEATSTIFEFWRATRDGDRWSAQWGAVNSLQGSGWGGSGTGSGSSRLAGVIRVAEIDAGDIPHALALQTNNACTTFRPPALKSDGTSTRADCIPEGARLQLDPALDLSKLGLTRGELAVARAMQIYGGYVMDVGGTPLSVSFELDTSAPAGTLGKVYKAAGFRWDYDSMEHVPWEKLRVL